MHVDGPLRGMDRPKKMQMQVTNIDLNKCNLFENLADDRLEWRNIINTADPNKVERKL